MLDARNPLIRGFFEVFNVPTRRTVTQWADDKRMLPSKGAAEPGKYRSARTPYMREPMDCLSTSSPIEEVVLMAAAQTGKALALNTPLPTPSGWTTMGEVKVGDVLFDQDGNQCRVTAKSPVFVGHKCFEVEFSDGTKIVADAGHRWETLSGHRQTRSVVTTQQIADTLKLRGNRFNHAIDVAGAIQCQSKELPIDPYVLGVWLGDGTRASAQVTAHEDDAREIAYGIARGGHRVLIRGKGTAKAKNLMIDPVVTGSRFCKRLHDKHAVGTMANGSCAECHRQRSNANQPGNRKPVDPVRIHRDSLALRLRALGLHIEKRIPEQYLRASAYQRELLLRGLMDTDGTCCKKSGGMSFCTASEPLANQFMELCRSIGLKPTAKRLKKANAWVVSFMSYREDISVFELRRKAERMRSILDERSRPTETKRRRIVSAREVDSVPVQCISVDSPRHLFLAGDGMIPTHNSESGNNWVGYVIDEAPGPMLLVQPTVDNAKRYSKQRISPMILETPSLRDRVPQNRSRDGGNNMLEKEFPGGILLMGGANSAAGLRSMPIRYLFADEISNWPLDVDGEGDPLGLAEERTNTFGRKRKIFKTSTPGVKDICRIEAEYLKTDQRRYFVPCPHCSHMHTLQWKNFVIPKDEEGRHQFRKAYMTCPECGGVIEERHKTDMLNGGEWVPTCAEKADPARRGYHISALYSPVGWKSWAKIARQWVEAQGSPKKLQAFVNNVLAETWEEAYSSKLDADSLSKRAEPFDLLTAPAGGLVLTAGVDVQENRIEIQTVAWGISEEAWIVNYAVIFGDPSRFEIWQQVLDVINTPIRHASGADMHVYAAVVDSGDGNKTNEVYSFTRQHRNRHILAGKGMSGSRPPIGAPTKQDINIRGQKIKSGAHLYPIGVDSIKSTIYGRLKRPEETGAGVFHFPLGLPEEYFDQLTSEKQATKFVNGMPKRFWTKKDSDRNEALDTLVYAYAALHYCYSRHNRSSFWQQMLSRLEKKAEIVQNTALEAPAAPEIPVAPGKISLNGWRRG